MGERVQQVPASGLGLRFIVLGLALESGSWAVAGKLGFIWCLALLAGSSACESCCAQ